MIIAFGHRRKVGKDTATRFLINHVRWNYSTLSITKLTFAKKLKETAYDLFGRYGLQPTEYYEAYPDEKETEIPSLGMSARDIWIKFGNDCRAIMPSIWVDHAVDTSANISIMTDLRYPNEAEALLQVNGILVKIEREQTMQYDDEADMALADWNKWTYTIKNNGSLDELHTAVVNLTESLIHDRFAKSI